MQRALPSRAQRRGRGQFGQRRFFRQEYTLPSGVLAVDEQAEALQPQEIVESLDQYVIGQPSAKEAVAVALRERWRRLQLPEDKCEEVTPKNILIHGPSGCGKTEIIRRVSKLLGAPFVKVDASKFTRRGIVGASVTDMIVDLYDRAEEQCKTAFRQATKELSEKVAEDMLVEALVAAARKKAGTPAQQSDVSQKEKSRLEAKERKDRTMVAHLHDKLRQIESGGLQARPMPSGLEVIMLDPSEQRDENSKEQRREGAAVADEFPFATIGGRPLADFVTLSDQEASNLMREHILYHRKQDSGPVMRVPALRKQVLVEPGHRKQHVVVALRDGQRGPRGFPAALFLGGEEDSGTNDLGRMSEVFDALTRKVADSLIGWQHEESRSPVKEQCEKWGIVCIDEIDKVVGKKSGGDSQGWMNADVQQELLTLVEGTKVDLEAARSQKMAGSPMMRLVSQQDKVVIDTTHILFVCAGAFTMVKPKDMLVELLGRLPIRIPIAPLSESDLMKILSEVKYPLVQQQVDLFATEGVALKWEDDAVREMARVAFEINDTQENTGARVLHSVVREVLADWSFKASSMKGQTVTVTQERVRDKTRKLRPASGVSRYTI
eukprot:TRINITY_DN35917_c0_g1_i1.p1 TRINITY_DN35917_c0_g1~~TRINITY_DN35917_c0_g1_i1.p1  ORF type:complete len:643 (+),score=98.53 TRINITY_DN35917_c0_g1_i1:111-1931(+)